MDAGLFTVAWWVTAIVAGVLTSLFGSYLRDFLDSILITALDRSKVSREEHKTTVQRLKSDGNFRLLFAVGAIQMKQESVYRLVIGIIQLGVVRFIGNFGLQGTWETIFGIAGIFFVFSAISDIITGVSRFNRSRRMTIQFQESIGSDLRIT